MAISVLVHPAVLSVLAAIALLAFLNSEEARIPPHHRLDYRSSAWFHECAQWDPSHHRFLLSFFAGGGLAQVSPPPSPSALAQELVLVPPDPQLPGLSTLGFKVDGPRHRVVAAIANVFTHKFSAVAAYDMTSWNRIFLTQLGGPEKASLADDVAIDDEGNIYVTDTIGNLIWRVSADGSNARVLTDSQAFKVRPSSIFLRSTGLNGIVYHPGGFLLVSHTGGNALFKVSLDGQDVRRVDVHGGVLFGDGIALVSSNQLAVAGLWTGVKLVEAWDAGWSKANITHLFPAPRHRLATAVTVKDGEVFVNYLNGFGIPYISTISRAAFVPSFSSS